MAETPDTGAGDDKASYEDLMRQTRTIYRKLERSGLMTARQLREEWEAVEAAIFEALGAPRDGSGRAVGRAALDAAREVQAKWMPDQPAPEAGHESGVDQHRDE